MWENHVPFCCMIGWFNDRRGSIVIASMLCQTHNRSRHCGDHHVYATHVPSSSSSKSKGDRTIPEDLLAPSKDWTESLDKEIVRNAYLMAYAFVLSCRCEKALWPIVLDLRVSLCVNRCPIRAALILCRAECSWIFCDGEVVAQSCCCRRQCSRKEGSFWQWLWWEDDDGRRWSVVGLRSSSS